MNTRGGGGDWENGDDWDDGWNDGWHIEEVEDEWDGTLTEIAMLPERNRGKEMLSRGVYLYIPGQQPKPPLDELMKATRSHTLFVVWLHFVRKHQLITEPIPGEQTVAATFLGLAERLPDDASHRTEFQDGRWCFNLTGSLTRLDTGVTRLVIFHVDIDAKGKVVLQAAPMRYVAPLRNLRDEQ